MIPIRDHPAVSEGQCVHPVVFAPASLLRAKAIARKRHLHPIRPVGNQIRRCFRELVPPRDLLRPVRQLSDWCINATAHGRQLPAGLLPEAMLRPELHSG